jgi:GNAT superfamily N-acetyltransferase
VVEDETGALVGFLIGFISPDHPDQACVHLVGTSPNHRRAGLGRALYERFLADARAMGTRRVTAITWPGDPVSVAFHRALGFTADDGPGTQRLYGTPAYADYDAEGEDRVVFSREL